MKRQRASDLTVADLPKNRKEVFFDCLKERFLTFLILGVVLTVFTLPLIFVTILSDNAEYAIYSSFAAGAYNKAQAEELLVGSRQLFAFLNVPCYIVLAAGVAGVIRVIRQIVWGEGVFFMHDMFNGVRSNGLVCVVIGLIGGLLAVLFNVAAAGGSDNSLLLGVVKCVAAVVFVPIALYMISGTAVYKLGFFKLFKNSAILYLKTVPVSLIFLAAFALPYLITIIPIPLVKYIAMIIASLIYAPICFTAWLLYSFSVFDKFINKEHFPELYDRGVFGRKENNRI